MPNKNYDQVVDLLAAGTLHWESDPIVAVLVTGASLDSTDKVLTDTGGSVVTRAPIQGRWIGSGGLAMGLPAAFQQVPAGSGYQVLVAKDDGSGDPILLAYLDQDMSSNPITLTRGGTLIIRPTTAEPPTPPAGLTPPPTTGLWMVLL